MINFESLGESNFIFIEFPDGMKTDRIAYYFIPSSKVTYPQHISFSFFKRLQHKRMQQYKRWFYMKQVHDVLFDLRHMTNECLQPLKEKYLNLPLIKCKDLYDFYEKVGYDRKNKVFLKEIGN